MNNGKPYYVRPSWCKDCQTITPHRMETVQLLQEKQKIQIGKTCLVCEKLVKLGIEKVASYHIVEMLIKEWNFLILHPSALD